MRPAIAALALLTSVSAGGAGVVDLHEFHWRIPIKEPVATGTLCRIPIPDAVYDGSLSFPADLRLVGEDGTDWPFFIYSPGPDTPPRKLPLKPLPTPADAVESPGIQHIYFDTGYRFLPLRSLSLETRDDSFARAVKVFGRNHATNQWRWMADAGIHRLPGQERLRIDLKNSRYRYLKVELFNYDEARLTIDGAQAEIESQFLIAQPVGGGRIHLYFGSSLFILPRFELQHRIAKTAVESAIPAEFGSRQRNPHRLMHKVRAYGRLLGLNFFGAAALFATLVLLTRRRTA